MSETPAEPAQRGLVARIQHDPWFQIVLISFISFCNPGMYNALTGMGGSGQVNSTVAANSNVATHAATAAAALVLVGAFYKYLGPRVSLLIGGWTYALYAGALLNYNRTGNGAFVIAAGSLLGLGAAFFWVAQGTVMVTYTDDRTRGRAIGLCWVIFNLGAVVGSLASFGLNFHSSSGTVTDSTYVAYMVIMLFGWLLSVFVVSAESLSSKYNGTRVSESAKIITVAHLVTSVKQTLRIVADWRVACLYPMFYTANIFYSYQQNNVNGTTFNLRTRSLDGALYWLAQMFGGIAMGAVLDWTLLGGRPRRALVGWLILFTTGMSVWGAGYKFQVWADNRLAHGLKQDIDYTQSKLAAGPMLLYFFYGAYDALFQSFIYWMIGAQSHSPTVNAVIVGTYAALKPAGGAMAWRINAEGASARTQFYMNWGMTAGSVLLALPSVLAVRASIDEQELAELDKADQAGQSSSDNEPVVTPLDEKTDIKV